MINKISYQKGLHQGIIQGLKPLKIQLPSRKVLALTGALALSGFSSAFASANNQPVNDILTKTEVTENEELKCSDNKGRGCSKKLFWIGGGIAAFACLLFSACVAMENEDDLGTPGREGF